LRDGFGSRILPGGFFRGLLLLRHPGGATYNVSPTRKSSRPCFMALTYDWKTMSLRVYCSRRRRDFGANTYGVLFSPFKAGLYVDVLGSLDPETDAVAADLQDCDFHFLGNDNLLVLFTADDQHWSALLHF